VTPDSAGWKYLGFRVIALRTGETYREQTQGTEVALVLLKGKAGVEVRGAHFELTREDVFAGTSNVLYVPPRQEIIVTASSDLTFSTGSAPAEGKYPTRLFTPAEMRQEVRGGGAATRQVNHVLAHPLPAERLILYEVYVPGGMWSGWPPHRHDGDGAPYLEETYYYLFQPDNGFGFQRNYRDESGFDELFTVKNGDVAVVAEGYHPVACAPGANMFFLNYQAGDLFDGERGTPPYEDPARVWIKNNWEQNVLRLPVGEKKY
jgi:5-deoxy-glucuronate isomerase